MGGVRASRVCGPLSARRGLSACRLFGGNDARGGACRTGPCQGRSSRADPWNHGAHACRCAVPLGDDSCCRMLPHAASCCLMLPHAAVSLHLIVACSFRRRFSEVGKQGLVRLKQCDFDPRNVAISAYETLRCLDPRNLTGMDPDELSPLDSRNRTRTRTRTRTRMRS
jgi:hypothetical protein